MEPDLLERRDQHHGDAENHNEHNDETRPDGGPVAPEDGAGLEPVGQRTGRLLPENTGSDRDLVPRATPEPSTQDRHDISGATNGAPAYEVQGQAVPAGGVQGRPQEHTTERRDQVPPEAVAQAVTGAPGASGPADNLDAMKLVDLRAVAGELGIAGRSRMKKVDLIRLIREKRGG